MFFLPSTINNEWLAQDCELHSIATRFGSIAAQFRDEEDEKTGFAFVRCRVTGTGPLYVGRAMGQYARIVYSYTYFDDVVAHGGWDDWDHTNNINNNNRSWLFMRPHTIIFVSPSSLSFLNSQLFPLVMVDMILIDLGNPTAQLCLLTSSSLGPPHFDSWALWVRSTVFKNPASHYGVWSLILMIFEDQKG